MTAFWQFPYEPDPEDPEDPGFLEVTGFGDPVRSFLPGPRDPSPAELAEFRAKFLADSQRGPFGVVILPPEPHGIVHRPREQPEPPEPPAPRRGQCQGCGTDGGVDIWSRCAYCAELAALRARNLPGPRLSGWWMTIPAGLALVLLTALVYAVASVILAG